MTAANNGTALQIAIENGDFQLAQIILSSHPECVDYQVQGWTALHRAANLGHENTVSLLLEMGAAVNMPTQNRNASALMLAVNQGFSSVIARLIEWGADVNQAANERWMRNTPLHVAACHEQTGPLHLLLLRGANVNATNLLGDMALDMAVKQHHKSNTILLKEFARSTQSYFGAGIRSRILEFQMGDFVDRSGTIYLDAGAIWAVRRRRVALVEYILDIDPRLVNVCDEDLWVLPHHSAWNGDHTMAELLLDRGAQVNTYTKSRGCTPLHLAAQRGHQPTVELLLAKGGNLYTKTYWGSTARMLAIRGNHESVVRTIDERIREDRQKANAQIRRAQPEAAKTTQRRVSLDNYHLQEKDEHDSSDESSNPDGYDGELSDIKPSFTDRQTFTLLITTWKDWCQAGNGRVKIAILDTGIDEKNKDLKLPRVEAFIKGQSGYLETRLAEGETAPQLDRVKGRLNLARGIQPGELDIQDLDGHGTKVAGIILRLAPAADLYIARVCDGRCPSSGATLRPTHHNVADAIKWAVETKVDIINLSLGFDEPDSNLSKIIEKAKASGILIMAAMSNSGNYYGTRNWPAKDFTTTIGIHSCKPKGTFPSEFTPPAIPQNPNFMVAGEAIVVHKFPYPVGIQSPGAAQRFELAAGTSYATPVATCMAALILSFVRQSRCRELRREALNDGLDVTALLKDHYHMATVFKAVGKSTWGGYIWISPELLWTGFRPPADGKGVAKAGQEYAWNIIRTALKQHGNSYHPSTQ